MLWPDPTAPNFNPSTLRHVLGSVFSIREFRRDPPALLPPPLRRGVLARRLATEVELHFELSRDIDRRGAADRAQPFALPFCVDELSC